MIQQVEPQFLSLHFRSKGLKLSPTFLLNLTLTLENVGETAYDPVLSFYFSRILFFQGVSVLQVSWRKVLGREARSIGRYYCGVVVGKTTVELQSSNSVSLILHSFKPQQYT